MMKKISLIVPTYNRSSLLKRSLESFNNQNLSQELFEIIVVDNNSHDNTQEVIFSFIKKSTIETKYVFEGRQGLHYARNSGIIHARGTIIVFGDDDIIASSDWLKTILDHFESHQSTGIVGGKILPLWTHNPPEWIYDYGTKEIHALFAYLNYGEEKRILEHEYLFGCNLAIKKDLIVHIGGSPPDTFPQHLKYLSGSGECLIIDEARHLGHHVVYLPEATVHHHVDASRITLQYFIDRHERFAIENAFNCYRSHKKITATVLLIKKALKNLLTAYFWQCKNLARICLCKKLLPLNKIKPLYFITIQKASSWALLKQIGYILFQKDLYQQIIKKNYFE